MRHLHLTALLALVGCGGAVTNVTTSSDRVPQAYDRVTVRVDAGDVTVEPLDCDCVDLEAELHWRNDTPELTWVVEGDTLVVTATCGQDCWTDLTISLPAGAVVDVHTGAGDIDVTDVTGVTATTDAGDIEVFSVTGPVDVHSDAGDVDVTEVTGDVEASTRAGDVEVFGVTGDVRLATNAGDVSGNDLDANTIDAWTEAGGIDLAVTRASWISATTVAGDVTLDVPRGAWQLDLRSVVGDVSVSGVTDDAEAPRAIEAASSAGTVTVEGH